jgi:hypothetical protein
VQRKIKQSSEKKKRLLESKLKIGNSQAPTTRKVADRRKANEEIRKITNFLLVCIDFAFISKINAWTLQFVWEILRK